MTRGTWRLVPLVLISAVIAAACGGSSGSGTPAATTKRIVVFMPPGTDNYLAEWERGAKQEAAQLGYEIKIVENKFDQSEEDVQVQQQLASGDKPGAYVWWPVDNAAGVASLRKLGQSGVPVIAANQLPLPGTENFWAAYSGVDDVLNGSTSGKMMIELRDKLKANGVQFHSPGGNVMIIGFPQGYSAGPDRVKGFTAATSGSGITVIDTQPAGFDATKGFQVASQMISANKSKGIDLVYNENDALADGAIQALQQAGYKPGVNVGVIGGTCHGKLDNLASGAEFGTGLQAAFLEGIYVVITANRYLTGGGKVTSGKDYAAADPANIPSATGTVFKYNFIPNPAVHSNEIDSTRLWGYTMRQLCTY